jgi:hypothetical protein
MTTPSRAGRTTPSRAGRTKFRFEGGPLNGTERIKDRRARPPLYLTADGSRTLYVQKGDRIYLHAMVERRRRMRTPDCYRRHTDVTMSGGRRTITYRYITCEAPGQWEQDTTPFTLDD